jgi:hypothetical protein
MPHSGQTESLGRAAQTYAAQLAEVMPAADRYGAISYLSDHAVSYAQARGYGLGLVADPLPGDTRFTGMLSIPYMTRAGVRAMKYRNLRYDGGTGIKYSAPTGQKPRLYNTAAYFAAGDVIGLAEGELDAIAATEHLRLPTMGIPGAEMWHNSSRVWGPVFADYRTVVLFADGDDAGRELAKDVAETIGWRLRVVDCDGSDVSGLVAVGQAGDLISRWQKAAEA